MVLVGGTGVLWWFGNLFWRPWALTVLLSIIALAVIVLAIKFSIRRRRPEGTWGAMYRSTDPHSFPSGHAARAILIAILAIGLGPWWLAILLCVWAPLVALARVAMGLHYLSDIARRGSAGGNCRRGCAVDQVRGSEKEEGRRKKEEEKEEARRNTSRVTTNSIKMRRIEGI